MLDWHVASVKSRDSDENDDYAEVNASIGAFLVADGMGGRPGGAQASRVAAASFLRTLMRAGHGKKLDSKVLLEAVAEANREVRAVPSAEPLLEGLGTTLSAAVMNGSTGKVVHIGDSRVYLFRNGALQQLTRDHTLGAELVERHHLTADAASRHPLRNLLSRAVGTMEEVTPEIYDFELNGEDCLVLATDGLSKSLPVDELCGLISRAATRDSRSLCEAIMAEAMDRSPVDDVTVIVVRLVEEMQ